VGLAVGLVGTRVLGRSGDGELGVRGPIDDEDDGMRWRG